mgnify:CR=1
MICCAQGVWRYHRAGDLVGTDTILTVDRGQKCFYYPYEETGLKLDAAKELERRRKDRREAEKDRRLTRHMVFLTLILAACSIGALALNSCVNYFGWSAKSEPNQISSPE